MAKGEDCCGNCYYGENYKTKELLSLEEIINTHCHFHPTVIKKLAVDWCGQHEKDSEKIDLIPDLKRGRLVKRFRESDE